MPKREGETCQRCGEVGQDRRTLWMACFYDMRELTIPFEVREGTPEYPQRLFTLRVCKGCRVEWMQAIEKWFATPRSPSIDENGTTTL